MKKTATAFCLFLLSMAALHAQVVLDTTSMSSAYQNQMFYSLANGDVKASNKFNWDLAFTASLEDAAILANHATGLSVYQMPAADTANWSTLDTTGMSSWPMLINSDTFWRIGAFNHGENLSAFNFGWGIFNLVDYNVHAFNRLYVLALGNGSFKKLWLKEKTFTNHYIFRIANLDNSMDYTKNLDASAVASNRNFLYYSASGDSLADVEPAKGSWDILFQQYMTILQIPQPFPYLVAGAWSNPAGVSVAEVDHADFNTVAYPGAGALDTMATEIGYDWKVFTPPTGPWVILDSNIYFVKAMNGDIWKLHFTGFGAGPTGDVMLGKERLTTSVSNLDEQPQSVAIYPNPADGSSLHLLCSLSQNAEMKVVLSTLQGQVVLQQNIAGTWGLQSYAIPTPDLSTGVYLLNIKSNGTNATLKVVVAR